MSLVLDRPDTLGVPLDLDGPEPESAPAWPPRPPRPPRRTALGYAGWDDEEDDE